MVLAIAAAALCAFIAPAAAGSGIPEAKAYLNGVDAPSILNGVDAPSILAPRTLLVKEGHWLASFNGKRGTDFSDEFIRRHLHCRMIDAAPFNMYTKAYYKIIKTDLSCYEE